MRSRRQLSLPPSLLQLEALIEAEAAREVEEAERATGPYSPTVPARDSDALVRAVRAGDLNRVAHMVEVRPRARW